MRGNDAVEDQALERLRDLAGETVERVRRVLKEANQAGDGAREAHQHAISARTRAALAKRRELAAHARAIEVHERAAELQERLGHPDRAANARAHAEHARGLQVRALEEQRAGRVMPAGEHAAVMRIAGWRSREMLARYGASAADARPRGPPSPVAERSAVRTHTGS